MMQLRWFSLGILISAFSLSAQEPIRMARTPDISPDGKLVAFSYQGDIWTVPSTGGVARPVTQHLAHELNPVFSPDGKWLAFASKRYGRYDVFVAPVVGGKPRRLTWDSASDVPTGWSPDGKNVLFVSNRHVSFPAAADLYSVPFEGGRERRITKSEGREGTWSPTGDRLAYVRGPGAWYRKGYHGSSNNDIWICDPNGDNNRQVTTFDGQDASPMWSPDGQNLYYVSETLGGAANIVKQDVAGASKATLVTAKDGKPFHIIDGVRMARISRDGKTIVYECGGDIWLVGTNSGATPRKLDILAYSDDKTNSERTVTLTTNATEFALSRDERHVVFAVHGELFLMPVASGAKATRLTTTSANNQGVAWAPDGKKIVFISDRNGYDDLYLLEGDDPDHPNFVEAHQFKVKQLTNTREGENGVAFSPDGNSITFLRDGRLWTMKPDGTNAKVLVDTPQIIDYEWSPDSKWIVYSRMDGSFASELYIMPAAGGEAKNVTRYATYNAGVTWSADGKKLAFLSIRRNREQSLFTMSLQKDVAPGVPAGDAIDWEDIHQRVTQPAPMEVSEGAINSDGSKVAFVATSQGNTELWVASTGGGSVTRITTGNVRPRQIQWSRKLSTVLYFRDGNGQLRLARLGGTGLGGITTDPTTAVLPFKVKMTVKDPELYAEMLEQGWRFLADNFYDNKFHGTDWEAVRTRYRPLVQHVNNKEDMYALLYMMLGELNASHVGVSGDGESADETTAQLGLVFDETYAGPALKVAEVLKRGPADQRGINLKPGDFIHVIDDVELTPQTNIARALNAKVGETVVLLVSDKPTVNLKDTAQKKALRRVEIRAIAPDASATQKLYYERWVEANAKRVAELSKGKLGYIHIPSMNEEGLDRFVRSLYSDNFDKEAIILDVRFNGGGHTHDQVLNYLGAKEHTFFRHRQGGEGLVLRSFDRKWTKPVVLLINNRSYSDAEILPNAFRTLGLGKLVGQATGGHVIGTGSFRLIDGSTFRIPRIGVFTLAGINMEKEGVKPDVEVIPHPDQLVKGQDVQLDKAVEILSADVAAWKKAKTGISSRDELPKPPPGPSGEK